MAIFFCSTLKKKIGPRGFRSHHFAVNSRMLYQMS